MHYLAIAWKWLVSLFTSKTAGTIFKIIFSNVTSKVVSILSDDDLQKFAYNTAVELRADDSLSTVEKTKQFNIKMADYIKSKNFVSSTSLINALRELACQAIKVNLEKGTPLEPVA